MSSVWSFLLAHIIIIIAVYRGPRTTSHRTTSNFANSMKLHMGYEWRSLVLGTLNIAFHWIERISVSLFPISEDSMWFRILATRYSPLMHSIVFISWIGLVSACWLIIQEKLWINKQFITFREISKETCLSAYLTVCSCYSCLPSIYLRHPTKPNAEHNDHMAASEFSEENTIGRNEINKNNQSNIL